MITGDEKLARDVDILAAMAQEAPDYLDSDVLFWPLSGISAVKMTLGGYLMRQHRLLALQDQLDAAQAATVDTAVVQFNQALVERVVRFETKGNHEIDARLRQWSEYLRDVEQGVAATSSNYATAVDARVMLTALKEALEMPPYRLAADATRKMDLSDLQLRRLWVPGDFVWPEEWAPAYPPGVYWYLYGEPRSRRANV